jgi:hypothetical protein
VDDADAQVAAVVELRCRAFVVHLAVEFRKARGYWIYETFRGGLVN